MFAFCFKKLMAARRITDQQVEVIVKFYAETGSIAYAAKNAGVSETTASSYLVSLGHHKRKPQIPFSEGAKYCGMCRKMLPLGSFSARKNRKDSWCKSCNNVRNRPHALRQTLRKLRLSSDEYEQLLKQSQSRCAICGTEEGHISKSGNKARLSIDHDHSTGSVHGLLCNRCNRGLGYFSDSTDLLSKALHYLLEAERKR